MPSKHDLLFSLYGDSNTAHTYNFHFRVSWFIVAFRCLFVSTTGSYVEAYWTSICPFIFSFFPLCSLFLCLLHCFVTYFSSFGPVCFHLPKRLPVVDHLKLGIGQVKKKRRSYLMTLPWHDTHKVGTIIGLKNANDILVEAYSSQPIENALSILLSLRILLDSDKMFWSLCSQIRLCLQNASLMNISSERIRGWSQVNRVLYHMPPVQLKFNVFALSMNQIRHKEALWTWKDIMLYCNNSWSKI